MGAAASSVAVSSSDSIHVARQHAQLACAQLTDALTRAKVLARVGVKVDLTFARQTLEFKVTQAMIDAGAKADNVPNVFPPESVLGIVRDVQRLTAMVAARNLDAVFETATATRCFTAGEATFLVSVSVDTECYINARRPSLIQGKTVEQVGDALEASLGAADAAALTAAPGATTAAPAAAATEGTPAPAEGVAAEGAVATAATAATTATTAATPAAEGAAEAAIATAPASSEVTGGGETKEGESEKSIEKLKKGILVTKHPRKGSPEARTFWFTGDRFCIAKKLQKKVSSKTKGWSVDDPNGFGVIKGQDSPVFERTLKKYGAVDTELCLSVQLHDRTIDLQFDSTETRNMVFTAIKTFLPDMGDPMEKKFTQSLGIGIGKRAIVQKVVVAGAGAVNDVRIGDVILEINGTPVSGTMTAKVLTDMLSSSIKDKGEVLVKFARVASASESNSEVPVVLTETQQNVNELMDLMFRAAGKLSHYHTGTGERHVEVSCKHPLTELMVALVVVDTKDLNASPERSPSPFPKVDVTAAATEGKNTDLVDGAVELLNSNLLPVMGATAAISEGSAQLKDLNGSIVMHCTIADNTKVSPTTPVAADQKLESIPAPPQLAKEGSMLDLGSKKGASIGRTNSVLRKKSIVAQGSDA